MRSEDAVLWRKKPHDFTERTSTLWLCYLNEGLGHEGWVTTAIIGALAMAGAATGNVWVLSAKLTGAYRPLRQYDALKVDGESGPSSASLIRYQKMDKLRLRWLISHKICELLTGSAISISCFESILYIEPAPNRCLAGYR